MVDDPITAHYGLGFERDRLFRGGAPRLELTRTLELLDRFLPSAPARLIDVGGGPGAYAAVWAHEGYDVRLYDVLELHVQQARLAADAQAEHSFTAQVADARSIPEPDGSADAVVLLGPLYHLTDRAQRASALLEARRILKPSGVVAAVGISRFAALLDGLWQGWLSDPLFRNIAERDLVDGQHRNPDPVATRSGLPPPTSTALRSSRPKSGRQASMPPPCTELRDRAGSCRSTGRTPIGASRCCSRHGPSNRSQPSSA